MVDREATCQWLVKLANILQEEEKTGDEITFHNLKAFHERILDVMALILDIPRWTPCSEKLPDPGQDVILVYRDDNHNNEIRVSPAWRGNVWEPEQQNGIWILTKRMSSSANIEDGIAWTPLPEPSKEMIQKWQK